MGTRALFRIFDETGTEICDIYVHYDGYPEGWGLEVVKFLASKRLTNGIPLGEEGSVFNRMEDLTAQLITYMKLLNSMHSRNFTLSTSGVKEITPTRILAGNVYVYPPNTTDADQEYEYHIYPEGETIIIKVIDVWENDKVLFEGTPEEYIEKFSEAN